MVGRSNVGKSSLINALVRKKLARKSAAPGKKRVANFYRVAVEGKSPFYLVELPGYGYARGGDAAREEFDALAAAYFGTRAGTRASAACSCSSTAGTQVWTPTGAHGTGWSGWASHVTSWRPRSTN